MNSDDDTVKLSKKEYYRNYQIKTETKLEKIVKGIIRIKLLMKTTD